jgi:GT2 family glycosyltransferase
VYADTGRPRMVDYLPGACLMLRSEAIKAIGLLDERFFMYFEEADWCYRIRLGGGSVYYCPSANVVHYGTSELGHFDEVRLVNYHKSMLLFYQKHYAPARLFWLRLILMLRSIMRIVVWSGAGVLRPSIRHLAVSSAKGYLRTIGLLTRRF